VIGSETKDKLLAWLPTILAGQELELIETADYMGSYPVPSMSISYLSAGPIQRWAGAAPMSILPNENGDYDEKYGQHHKLTISIGLRSYDSRQLDDMSNDFLKKIFKNRQLLSLRRDGFCFVEVLSNRIRLTERDEKSSKKIYRAIFDLLFEYEICWLGDEPAIMKFGADVTVPGSDPLHLFQEVLEKTVGFAMSCILVKE